MAEKEACPGQHYENKACNVRIGSPLLATAEEAPKIEMYFESVKLAVDCKLLN